MKVRDFSKIFFAILILHLVVLYRPGPSAEMLLLLSKVLIPFSLLAFFLHKTSESNLFSKHYVSAALLCAGFGDFFLEKEGTSFFLIGMGFFALTQIGYTSFYIKNSSKFKSKFLWLFLLIPAAAFYVLLNFINIPSELKWPILIYAGLLSCHFLAASNFSLSWKKTAWLCALGAFLFIVSDFMVAHSRFETSHKYLEMALITIYAFAQFSIVIGILEILTNKEKQLD